MVVLAALWTAWTLYSRRQNAREDDLREQQKQAEADRRAVAVYGGDQFKILNFGAEPSHVSAGGRVLLCYGVANAAKVSIVPGVEPIKPALLHCLNVFPTKTTTYTLSAEDGKGNHKSGSLTIKVP